MRLSEIVARLGGERAGKGDPDILQVATLARAGAGDIAFLANPKYRSQLPATRAAAVILHPEEGGATELPRVLVANPYAYYARVAQLLNPPCLHAAGVHASAAVSSAVPPSCHVGALSSIGRDVRLGERVVIHAGCHIGDEAEIGDDSVLHPGVIVYPGCRLGRRAIVHAGAVIGADGFGFAREDGRWIKIPQIGAVRIGDDVEVGAGTTIDRGAMEDTVIGDGVKLDNQIQIAHNVVIGEHSALAGCVGVAGSAKIGRRCTIGGAASILGHLELADDVHVSAGSMVMKSIRRPGEYTGIYPTEAHGDWMKNAVQLRHLDRLAQRVRELERRLETFENETREERKAP